MISNLTMLKIHMNNQLIIICWKNKISKKSKHFSEKDIDEFRQCFKLYAPEGHVTSPDKLGFIMRSLNIKPTLSELKAYFIKHKKEGIVDFAEFLDILHVHLQTEHAAQEILNAFRIFDTRKTGYISTKDLKFLLTMTGEKLTNKDGKFKAFFSIVIDRQ